jgi:hypothetical protein
MAKELELQWCARLKGVTGNISVSDVLPFLPAGVSNVVFQEQFQVKLDISDASDSVERATARSRKLIDCDGVLQCTNNIHYDFEHKVAEKGKAGLEEPYLVGSAEVHEVYRALARSGLSKYRVSYPCDITVSNKEAGEDAHPTVYETKWEIDFFVLADGTIYPWIKVDLEYPAILHDVIIASRTDSASGVHLTPFPVKVSEVFDATYGVVTPEDSKRLGAIMAAVSHKTDVFKN